MCGAAGTEESAARVGGAVGGVAPRRLGLQAAAKLTPQPPANPDAPRSEVERCILSPLTLSEDEVSTFVKALGEVLRRA